MTDIVPVTAVSPDFDYSGLRLEHTVNGHVVSPWFSYDYRQYHRGPVYQIGSHYHSVCFQSIAAFAQALNIGPTEVVVSQMKDPATGDLKWRLGTQHPVELPKPKFRLPSQATITAIEVHADGKVLRANGPAIDI